VKLHPFLLDAENSSNLGDSTVGNAIRQTGQDQLWAERSSPVDTIVIHFMSDRFRHPRAPFKKENLIFTFIEYGVSAHYLILRNGMILNLVPEQKKAWHAGGSIMPEPDNRTGVNDFSIGIELAGSELHAYTDRQYQSLKSLIADIRRRHEIIYLVGHETISGQRAVDLGIRGDCKIDPGPNFDWKRIELNDY